MGGGGAGGGDGGGGDGGGEGGGGEGGGDGGGEGGGGDGGRGGGDVPHSRWPMPASQGAPDPMLLQQYSVPPPHGPSDVSAHMMGKLLGHSWRLPRVEQQSPTSPWQFCVMGKRMPSLHSMTSTSPVVVSSHTHESSG